MSMTRIVTLPLFVVMLTLVPMAYGEGKVQKNGFAISFPDGWVEIPKEAIDAYEKAVAELAPGVQVQHYDYGFQMNSSTSWLEYPYILIQIKNVGRIPESQLKDLEEFPMEKTIEEQKEKFSGVMSDLQAGKMNYDGNNKIIWMRLETNVRGVGPVTGLVGMVLTEQGFIQVNAYCAKDDYPTYDPIFRSIVTSVVLDPGLAYQPKWSDGLPAAISGINWNRVAERALIGAIIGGVVALIASLRKKKHRG